MKKTFFILLSCFTVQMLHAQSTGTFKSPKELRSTVGEFVTESNEELAQRTYQLQTFKTKDGGTATFLKFDQPQAAPQVMVGKSEINIFPNPTAGKFHVTLSHAANENSRIEIFNLLGVRLLEIKMESSSETDVDLATFSNGIFILKCISGNEVMTNRIIKE